MKAMASNGRTMRAFSASVLDDRHELEVDELLPDLEGRDEEVVHGGDAGRLEQELRLRAALLAGDEDLGDRGRLGIRELPVHLAHEVAAQRDQEEDAEAAAGEADEDRLPGVRVELQDVERRQREDRAGDDRRPRRRRSPVMMTFSRSVERRR